MNCLEAPVLSGFPGIDLVEDEVRALVAGIYTLQSTGNAVASRAARSLLDEVCVVILDFLWTDRTGLPEPAYTEQDVDARAEDVFRHVYRAYPVLPSPLYAVQ
jgi:hypothetical protein